MGQEIGGQVRFQEGAGIGWWAPVSLNIYLGGLWHKKG